MLFLFFAAFPFIFTQPPYSFTPSQSGLTFLSIGLGVLIGSATSIIIDKTIYQPKHRAVVASGKTNVEPEHRLYAAMMGAVGILVGLFWFGWCADKGVHWGAVLVGAVPFAWGNLCLFVSFFLWG